MKRILTVILASAFLSSSFAQAQVSPDLNQISKAVSQTRTDAELITAFESFPLELREQYINVSKATLQGMQVDALNLQDQLNALDRTFRSTDQAIDQNSILPNAPFVMVPLGLVTTLIGVGAMSERAGYFHQKIDAVTGKVVAGVGIALTVVGIGLEAYDYLNTRDLKKVRLETGAQYLQINAENEALLKRIAQENKMLILLNTIACK